jgi:DNA polymerase V
MICTLKQYNNKKAFTLVDCNNFYVSCERVWNPKLRNVPVLVLSNNDGCVIARSNEVKEIGISMGQPFYQVKEYCRKMGVRVLSANFPLYADFSNRVVQTLRQFASEMEVYSIDESFLMLDKLQGDFIGQGLKIRSKLLKDLGLPVGVGIGKTKTLAKIANQLAKKHEDFRDKGVCDLADMSEPDVDEYLKTFHVRDIWGVGRAMAPKLESMGISSAYALKYADSSWIRKNFKVMGARIVLELKGVICLNLDHNFNHPKSIACTRSFGRPISNLEELEESVSLYASRATEKLRKNKSVASMVTVFIKTNKHKKNLAQYSKSISGALPELTFDTADIVKASLKLLRVIYKKGFLYKKAGIILSGIDFDKNLYSSFFDLNFKNSIKKKKDLMLSLDKINKKWGRGTVYIASQGVKQSWSMKSAYRSQRFTTDWRELPSAKVI